MKIFSTFTGIGGFEIGIRNAGHLAYDKPIEIVGYSEIDKYAISVYEQNFEGVKNYGDITKINASELPDFDCLVGGFPCQAFSIAGKRGGFADTRGTLFFDLARILKEKQPRLFVFENVKGLLSHDKGRTLTTIIATIDELGYDCQWQVLNSKNHGVPQSRERIIIVGHLRGTPRPQVFPITGTKPADTLIRTIRTGGAASYTEKHARDIIRVGNANPSGRGMNGNVIHSDGISSTLSTNKGEGIKVAIGTLRTHKDGEGFREMKSGLSPTLPARAREDGSGQPIVVVPEATRKGYAEAGVGDSINLQALGSTTRRGRIGKGEANTIDTTMQQHTLTEDARIRRLTPKECERLQAFPDDWTKYGLGGVLISDTQRYKMCGNAVTTNVIRDVFIRVFQTW